MSISPYYQQDGITIYHGDFREIFPQVVRAASVDLAMADPPYGETSLEWDHWPDRWPADVLPYVKPSGSMWCFGSLRMFLDRRDDFNGWKMSHEVVWEKHNGSGFHVDRFRRVHELAVHYTPAASKWADTYKSPRFTLDATARTVRKKEKPAQWHGKTGSTTYVSQDGGPRMMRSVLQVRSCHGHALNETEKPAGILRPLIEYACPPGGLLLVPFVGSGSDLAVARELGIKAIGCEVREQQCEVAANRMAQGILFSGAAQ
ncbi:MAG: site-specific DNA-methyltransferase [Tepidisphaeraceae bacterium]